ncbi:MAG: UPF0182 family protein [Actinomycetia bacterium]|nr:UPF0182 family protein [Actinomycetes bacterium]
MKTVRDNVRGSRFRLPIAVALGVLFVLLLSANGVASTYTDWLWFSNTGFGSVWTTILGTQIALAVVFTLIFFFLLWGNLILADRLAPDFRPASPEEDLIERYHQLIGSRAGRLRVVVAAIFALIAGANTASRWQDWLLFANGGSFGRADPLFGRDVGFYVFQLPFLSFVVDWLFAAMILTLIIVAVAHYLNGGIRASAPAERVTPGVKLHLSILLAALAVVRAAGYWLDRFGLLNSDRGVFDGALATDVNVQLPAFNLLTLISLFGAALFVANVRRQGWGLPVVAIGLWAVSHLFVGSLFPALYQRLRIEPQESTREADFVERNIVATRFAYGLDASRLQTEDFVYTPGLTAEEVDDYASVLDNVPLLDPGLAIDSFTRSQGERAFYRFSDPLDVDRYQIDGQLRPVVLSMRGLDLGVDEVGNGWEAQHIVFTHGYGAAMAAGWEVDTNGRPSFLVRELGEVAIDEGLGETLGQPRAYFGEDFDGYAIVNAGRDEVDYQTSSNESRSTRYEGAGGVPMGSFIRRTAFALRFRDLDPLIASTVTSDSRAIYNRDIMDRVRTLAPFLRFDSNPYPVIADDQLFWVIDGYTTTNVYPYAQTVSTGLGGSDLSGGFNYVRNSVKAVVDAYNGTVEFYIVDSEDPILEAWGEAFPGLFTPGSEIPPTIDDNLRYPEDIFEVQTDMWSTYVVSDPIQLVVGDVAWSPAAQPRREAQVGEGDTGSNSSMNSQYLVTRLPGKEDPEFVLQRAFVPRSGQAGSTTARPELTGIMMARSDPENYGQLVLYQIESGLVEAPDFVHSEIRKNDELTEFVKEKIGSVVLFGDMTLLLINDTIVYVRPVYVEAPSATAVPELSKVIVVNGDDIAMGNNLDEAIAAILDDADTSATAPDETETSDSGSTDDPATDDQAAVSAYDTTGKSVVELLTDAEGFLQRADVAESGDFTAEAAQLREDARTALLAAQGLLGGTLSGATSATGQDSET